MKPLFILTIALAQSETTLTLTLTGQALDPNDTVLKVSLENGRAPDTLKNQPK